MRHRFFLLPGGVWTVLASANPRLMAEGTILLDPHQPNPARRMKVLSHGTWSAMTEEDVSEVYARFQQLPPARPID